MIDLEKLKLDTAGLANDQRAILAARLIPAIREHRRRVREFAQVPPIACVYFLRDAAGLIKIGWTKNLRRRAAALQVISSVPLRLIGVVEGERNIEQWLHQRLADTHVRGEWYRPSEKLDHYLLGEGFIP